jgi:DNA topoisomerase-3
MDSVGVCPKCGAKVLATAKRYSCQQSMGGSTGCDFGIWKEVAGKQLSDAIVKKLLSARRTELLKGFKARSTGKAFEAHLVLSDSFEVTFEFPPRS